MYAEKDSSIRPKLLMVALHALAIAAAAWFLFGGAGVVAGWFGRHWPVADLVRRILLISLMAIYFLRLLLTLFVFSKRRISYAEAVFIGVWILLIDALMAGVGGTNPAATGWLTWAGVGLYAVGSCLNTVSEYQRLRWKRRPENKGRLYTQGLFKYAMHINYFGDEVLFCGLALVTGSVWAWIIPLIMACGFVFGNIPMLDRHLAEHYGAAFDDYARRTARFVPFVY